MRSGLRRSRVGASAARSGCRGSRVLSRRGGCGPVLSLGHFARHVLETATCKYYWDGPRRLCSRFFGISAWVYIGGYAGLIPGVFGVLGVVWIVVGGLALARRSQMIVVIDDTGIELPAFAVFQRDSPRVRIPHEDIVAVSKHQCIKGRLIEIATSSGPGLFQARHYCELDEFIAHCRSYGLPVA